MNHTLTNGLELLMCLAGSPRPHTVTELAVQLDLPQSHVHRLLQTLVENQYVQKDAKRRYMIGLGSLRLGHALLSHIPIRQAALPAMTRLTRKLKLAVTLVLPFGEQAISVAHVSHDGKIRPSEETLGGVLSPTVSASGKLFLAMLPAQERDEVIKRLNYDCGSDRAHRSAASLRRDLIGIAKRGYSLNDRESSPDRSSLAVPIFDEHGCVTACLGVSGPASAFTNEHVPELVEALRQCIDQFQPTPQLEAIS